MNKQAKYFSALLLFLLTTLPVFAQLQSPDDFLGYELGDQWTPHHNVMEYVHHVAEESDYVTIEKYGETNQHRELVYLIVTTPENHANIEEIRLNNVRLTGLEDGEITNNKKGIVWLSYNIHGNETSSSEASMKTLYELVRPDNQESKTWLENTVVILDPMVNPDGRDRYVNWFRNMAGKDVNPKPEAREHHEPWPGGRSNHYMFDLNRDWAWQVQKESKYRYDIYKQWFPHIHVDYHEQGHNSPYYFAPAAEPLHKVITDWQREFQTMIGLNHTRYFDEEGWHYFTRERFDLFYPSYGDTWPTYQGAIGMTYEQAGHSLAGLAIETQEGDTLTLADRLLHHHVTGMSTVEVASQNAERMIEEFENFFSTAQNNPAGDYHTFVVKADNNPDKIFHLLDFLDTKQVQYGTAGTSQTTNAYNFATGQTESVSVDSDDIVISTHQPQGNLVRVFFEPNPELADSVTYDITAWEAHYRFGLDGYALESPMNPEMNITSADFRSSELTGADRPYAYVLRWKTMDDARFLSQITQEGVRSRFSMVPFEIEGETYERGTLVITRGNNSHLEDSFDDIIRNAAENHSRKVHGTSTGFVESGSDFGSQNIQFIKPPNVAIVMGEGSSSLNAGEIWHYFDHQLQYPSTVLHSGHLVRADLDDYDVLVLPSGSYREVLTDSVIEKISAWTTDGGTLISFDQANNVLASRDGFQLQRKILSDEEPTIEDQLKPYGERTRRNISTRTPGSIFRLTMDNTHPMAFGYNEHYYSLKTGGVSAYNYLDTGWNVGTAQTDAHISGFAGHEAKIQLENSLSFGVQTHGSGHVVYMLDNPLFRGFWENGKLLVANAVFFVGN